MALYHYHTNLVSPLVRAGAPELATAYLRSKGLLGLAPDAMPLTSSYAFMEVAQVRRSSSNNFYGIELLPTAFLQRETWHAAFSDALSRVSFTVECNGAWLANKEQRNAFIAEKWRELMLPGEPPAAMLLKRNWERRHAEGGMTFHHAAGWWTTRVIPAYPARAWVADSRALPYWAPRN